MKVGKGRNKRIAGDEKRKKDSVDHLIVSPMLVSIYDQLDPSLCLMGVVISKNSSTFSMC